MRIILSLRLVRVERTGPEILMLRRNTRFDPPPGGS
jgi:hypothetical protein